MRYVALNQLLARIITRSASLSSEKAEHGDGRTLPARSSQTSQWVGEFEQWEIAVTSGNGAIEQRHQILWSATYVGRRVS